MSEEDARGNDKAFLIAAASLLEKWLLSGKTSFPLSVNPKYSRSGLIPSLSPGTLLLAEARLADQKSTAPLNDVFNIIETQRMRWRSAWQNQCAADFHTRLNRWKSHWQDLRNDDDPVGAVYAAEIRERVMLELLLPHLTHVSIEAEALLENLDGQLRFSSQSTSFIWPGIPSQNFPPDPFWFLYCRLDDRQRSSHT